MVVTDLRLCIFAVNHREAEFQLIYVYVRTISVHHDRMLFSVFASLCKFMMNVSVIHAATGTDCLINVCPLNSSYIDTLYYVHLFNWSLMQIPNQPLTWQKLNLCLQIRSK